MRNGVEDHFSIPLQKGDRVTCQVPIEGFLTYHKEYAVLELRPDEKRVVVIDDRGLEMWARADRFIVNLASEDLYLRLQAAGFDYKEIVLTEDRYYETFGVTGKSRTTCKDCGRDTKPGTGSARCPECWEDRCGR